LSLDPSPVTPGSAPDVAVIGAGIVGVSVAERLAAAGASVRVFEAAGVAAAASGRNSGVVQHPFDPVLAELHRGTLERYRRLTEEEPKLFQLPEEPAGLLLVSRDPTRLRAMAGDYAQTHPQFRPEFLAPGEVTRLEPAVAEDVAACRLALGYPVAPASATHALAARARDLGVRFQIGRPARLRTAGARVTGVMAGDRFEAAGAVVVAAGPWSPELIDPSGAWRPIQPLWGVVVDIDLADPPRHVLEEVGIDVEGGIPTPHGVSGPDPEFSLVTAGGTSSLGSTFLSFEPDREAVAKRLMEHGKTFVPAIAKAPVGASRACARPLSVDGRPLIGRVSGMDGLWIAAGHGPWGVSTGPDSGRLLADLLLGRLADPPPGVDPARFGAPPKA
jgi:glycine/D-amino acid oxidase-like deaminating enzyme